MTVDAAVFAVRFLLVVLFLPCSAADKMLNFRGAVSQAQQPAPRGLAVLLVQAGAAVEISMPFCMLTRTAYGLAGFVMAVYCMVTALLWRQFWVRGDFWAGSDSKGRGLFWDFLKNFSLAGGFLLLVVGLPGSPTALLNRLLASSHLYGQPASP